MMKERHDRPYTVDGSINIHIQRSSLTTPTAKAAAALNKAHVFRSTANSGYAETDISNIAAAAACAAVTIG